jgi:hypothetical protein
LSASNFFAIYNDYCLFMTLRNSHKILLHEEYLIYMAFTRSISLLIT